LSSGAVSRLNKVAAEHNIELPARWARQEGKPPPNEVVKDVERVRKLAASLPTPTAIMRALGVPPDPYYRRQLEEIARQNGFELPAVRKREKRDLRPLDDAERLRALAEVMPSRGAIIEALGLRPSSKEYARLEQRAQEFGITLPTLRACGSRGRRSSVA